MTKNIKTEVAPKLRVRESASGIFTLGVVVAESVSAYVLWFSGHSASLKTVSAVLVVDAAVRAGKAFTVVR